MATQSTKHTPEIVAISFVDQYYHISQNLIHLMYRFYKENSVLSWPLPDGEIKSVTTSEGINEFIVSSHFKSNKVEVTTTDCQSSAAGGVLVVVTGCLIGQDESRKRFSQTFFLTPQEMGYYVLNDIFRFIGVEESSTIVEEKVDKNVAVAPLATESKTENTIASSQKEKQVVETAPIIANEAPKVSYASMIKQGRPSSSINTPHKIVSVAANAGLPSKLKRTQANSFVQALMSSSSGVEKLAALPTNAAQDNYDDVQHKSIYIGGLPSNTTRSDLHAVVKEFGSVQIQDVQLKTYEDGYCCGFVHFQDAISAQNAVETHHIIVKGKEAYIRFKRPNKGRSERTNSPPDSGEKIETPSNLGRALQGYYGGDTSNKIFFIYIHGSNSRHLVKGDVIPPLRHISDLSRSLEMERLKFGIEKFDGSNFGFWKMQIEDYLYQKDLHKLLTRVNSESMKGEDWKLKDRQALGLIRLTLLRNVAFNIVKEKTMSDLL
ncbi:hypothetical protein CQW23_25444 [Capsicum baccatum]|uniref:G3BP-like protein n=1 Tax=Capsicum baccatum TaxID=33114 RepID=A0A2G2VKY6_CAPBA|nr:hypothetical protein CQW23_25444 [Capsicum baccatum]